MHSLTYLTLDKDVRQLRQSDVDAFAAQISGGVLGRGDDGYDEARKVWNGIVDRRPALIARCLNDERRAGRASASPPRTACCVSVRGGGHHIAGNAVAEGGLMIDLSGMRAVSVDPAKRTARVGAGRAARRLRSRGAGARPGDAARHQLDHRRRRAHARRRLRLADAPLRHDDRQPARRHGRDRRRRRCASSRPVGARPVLGHARRRRQLRRRDLVRVPAASGRPGGLRRAWSSIRSRRRARSCVRGATSPPTRPTN